MGMVGTIKSVCKKDGSDRPTFGFIRGADGIERFFLPGGMTQPAPEFSSLRPGDPVEFEHEENDKGPRAIKVRLVAA